MTNLEEYVGLKTLYLESNSIDELDGLLHLAQLRCLYMAKNALHALDGAARLGALTTLDVSDNALVNLEGLRDHPSLTTLVASGNRLATAAALEPLGSCPSLRTLDLSKNKLPDCACVHLIGESLGDRLKLLKLQGNPVVSEVPSYRKTVTCALPSLNYLDDAPVFPKDRRLAEAWLRGGLEEERAERARIFEDEKAERERQRRNFERMVTEARAEAEARRAAGVVPDPEDAYRFMSAEAEAEARLMREEGVPEWRVEEMRANEQLPWQVKEREAAEATRRARANDEAANNKTSALSAASAAVTSSASVACLLCALPAKRADCNTRSRAHAAARHPSEQVSSTTSARVRRAARALSGAGSSVTAMRVWRACTGGMEPDSFAPPSKKRRRCGSNPRSTIAPRDAMATLEMPSRVRMPFSRSSLSRPGVARRRRALALGVRSPAEPPQMSAYSRGVFAVSVSVTRTASLSRWRVGASRRAWRGKVGGGKVGGGKVGKTG